MHNVVLVTGGAGYIGAHACKALARAGFFPVTYDNLSSGNEGNVKWGPLEQGDVRDKDRLADVMKRYQPESVMHFAALIQVGDSVRNPVEYYDNNVFGSFCLLEAARNHGVKHMVFSSTAAVYGTPLADSVSESHPLSPINPYGHTKLAMENMIRDYAEAYGLSYAILRYFNAAGADVEGEAGTTYKVDTHIIPLLMRVASGEMDEIKIFGADYRSADGTAVRDYIHVQDLADAHVYALRHILEKNDRLILNLGTSEGYSVQEVINMARRVTGHPIPARLSARRPGDPEKLVADAAMAQKVLGWRPSRSDLKTIVSTAWHWQQKKMGQEGRYSEAGQRKVS